MPTESDRLARLARILEELVDVERRLEQFMRPPDAARLPCDLGAYRLTKELGRGGAGILYEAVHRESGRRVAVKALHLGHASRTDARVQLRREAEALATVRHPNLADFLEAGEGNARPFYVMSRIHGECLHEALSLGAREVPEDWRTLSGGLADVADALHRMHGTRLVHRDVRPANIVLASDGRMVLADFGLTGGDDLLALTRTGDARDTPAYMAPEQVMGPDDAVDARSDVYGLGATLYYVLTGHSPIEARDGHRMATAIVRLRPTAPRTQNPSVPRSLERIALKALEKKQTDRHSDAAALRDDLRGFAERSPRALGDPPDA